jgi:hypothetical protein
MRRLLSVSVVAVAVAALGVGVAPPSSTSAPPAPAAPPGDQPLDAWTATGVTADELALLSREGFDLHESHPTGDTSEVSLVMTADEAKELRSRGIDVRLARVKGGKTVRQLAEAQAVNGYNVWRSYDEPGGYRDQLVAASKTYPGVTKLVKLGTTYQGRDILALKVTQGARGQKDGSRPAVIYSATQHAREWIAPEMTRRIMNTYLQRWAADDKPTKKLLQSTELWFVPVLNPDGYEYTFTNERLWRKNLRDNNGNGTTEVGDGVDPNRNFPSHWGYDNEGSSPIPSSDTYRGPSAGSEPETQAAIKLFGLAKAEFMVNYHSNGRWLLYNDGWQVGTPTADDPIYYALSGNLDEPAIDGFHPGLSSDVLYITNGEIDGYAQEKTGTLAWTPELSPGCPGCGFVFPDDEQLVQEEFERNLPFAESVAQSAADPDDPKSSLGIKTKPFYLQSEDPYKEGIPSLNLTFSESYGDPQTVAVIAKRSLGAVTAKWKVNGGPTKSSPTTEWTGGDRFGMTSTHYHQVRGTVTGTDPGDNVEVWFEGGGQRSPSFTYRAVSESGNRVLVVAAEDYTGASPRRTRRQRRGRGRLGRGREGPHGSGRPGRAEPLRRGDLVHRRRHRDPHGRPRSRQRGPARPRRDLRVPRLHERGRKGALHRRPGRDAVLRRRRWHAALRPAGRDPLRRLAPHRHRPASLPALAGLGRQRQRHPAVLVRRLPADSQRRPRRGRQRLRRQRHRRPLRGGELGDERTRVREQPERDVVVHLDQRHPPGGRVPAVRELAVGPLGQAGRGVRPAQR